MEGRGEERRREGVRDRWEESASSGEPCAEMSQTRCSV